jgi:CHAT domain-containing protein
VHAAGHHDRPADGQKPPRTVLDRVASSYTPTLRALWEARNAGPHAGLGRVLYVAPDTPDQPRLRGSAAERDVLTVRFGDRLTCAENEKATRAAVQAGMLRHRWAHFSCHGGQELADPARGGLLLRDGLLTVRDLGQASFRGEFAFLAACKTATGGLVLSDEAITLTAALHYAGFQHVVGTLWSVSDLAASRIAAALYEELADDGTLHADRSARALHQAVRQLRSVDADDVAAWMPFTHTGP